MKKSKGKIGVKTERNKPVPKIYYRIFQQDGDGQSILDELAALFYDRLSYCKGDSYETAYKEGQRSVVAFIIRKCGLVNEEVSDEKNIDG